MGRRAKGAKGDVWAGRRTNPKFAAREKGRFLREYGVKFGEWNPNIQIDSTNTLFYCLIAGFAVALLFKNSAQKLQGFKLSRLNLTLAVLCFTLGVLNLHKMSQFLYFNF